MLDHPPILLATRNRGKVVEFCALLDPSWSVRGLDACPDAPEVEEDGATFQCNAIKKALALSHFKPDLLVLADDSGLEVDALNGAPGVRSARYAGRHGDDAANNAALLAALASVPDPQRGAQFRCVLAAARRGELLHTCEGVCRGKIGHAPAGDQGFGYDPLFVPEGWSQTFAQLSGAAKNRLSHRAQATHQFLAWLSETASQPSRRPPL